MTRDSTAASAILRPRAAIHAYLSQLAEQRRRTGLVPMNGRWIPLEARTAALKRAKRSGRVILLELLLLLLTMTGGSLLLLALTFYLAY
jgi:hypothetical protein